MELNKRIPWVDELKGFVMFAICMHHICDMIPDFKNTHVQSITSVLTAIGVPTYFFISGFLFNAKKYNSIHLYIKNKFSALLLPYLYLSLLFSLLDPNIYSFSWLQSLGYPRTQILESIGITNHIAAPLEWFVGDIICTLIGISSRATMPLWFVFILFFVSITYYQLNAKIKDRLIFYFICFLSLFLAFLCDYFNLGGYIHIGAFFCALFFYAIGSEFNLRKNILEQHKSLKFLLFIVSCIGLYLCIPYTFGRVDVVNSRICVEYPLHFFIVSISGIYTFICVFDWISMVKIKIFFYIRSFLRYVGKHSLIVLAIHFWALVLYFIYIQKFISSYNSIISVIFVFTICFLCIPLFRVCLYKFIGGERAKMSFKDSIKFQ